MITNEEMEAAEEDEPISDEAEEDETLSDAVEEMSPFGISRLATRIDLKSARDT